jgi:hypothetical protein
MSLAHIGYYSTYNLKYTYVPYTQGPIPDTCLCLRMRTYAGHAPPQTSPASSKQKERRVADALPVPGRKDIMARQYKRQERRYDT